jgi:hypothetical protein
MRGLDLASTAKAFFAALNEARWDEAASYVDPALAARERTTALSMLLSWAEKRAAGEDAHTLVGHDEVDLEMLQVYASTLVPGYRGAATLGDVAAFTPAEMMARTLENATLRPFAFASSAPEHRLRVSYELVDTVRESELSGRALYVERWPESFDAGGAVATVSLRRLGAAWQVTELGILPLRGFGPKMELPREV